MEPESAGDVSAQETTSAQQNAETITRFIELTKDRKSLLAALFHVEPPTGVEPVDCPALCELHACIRGATADGARMQRESEELKKTIAAGKKEENRHFDEMRRIDDQARAAKLIHANALEKLDKELLPVRNDQKQLDRAIIAKQEEIRVHKNTIKEEECCARFFRILPLEALKPDPSLVSGQEDIRSQNGSFFANRKAMEWASRHRNALSMSAPPVCGKRPSSETDVIYDGGDDDDDDDDDDEDGGVRTAEVILRGGKSPAKTTTTTTTTTTNGSGSEEENQPMETEKDVAEESPEPIEIAEPTTSSSAPPPLEEGEEEEEVMNTGTLAIAEMLPPNGDQDNYSSSASDRDDDDDGIAFNSDFTCSSSSESEPERPHEEPPPPQEGLPKPLMATTRGEIRSDDVLGEYDSPDDDDAKNKNLSLSYEDGLIGDYCKWCGQKVDETSGDCICHCWKGHQRSQCIENKHANGFFPNPQMADTYRQGEDPDPETRKNAFNCYRQQVRDIVVNGDPFISVCDESPDDPRGEGHVSEILVALFSLSKNQGDDNRDWCNFCRKLLTPAAKKNQGYGMCNACRVSAVFIDYQIWIPAKEKAGILVRASEYRRWVLARLADASVKETDIPREHFQKAWFWDKRGLGKIKTEVSKLPLIKRYIPWSWTGLSEKELMELGLARHDAAWMVQMRDKREKEYGPDRPGSQNKRKRSVAKEDKKKKKKKKTPTAKKKTSSKKKGKRASKKRKK